MASMADMSWCNSYASGFENDLFSVACSRRYGWGSISGLDSIRWLWWR